MPINIKQIFPSDSELNLIDKLNFNFDQLLLAGGGPPGPIGPIGLTGYNGSNGSTGRTGNTGNTGPVGSIGPSGKDGSGFQYYLINYSHGPTYITGLGPGGSTGMTSTAGIVDFACSIAPKNSYYVGSTALASNISYFGLPSTLSPISSYGPYSGSIPKFTIIQDQVNTLGLNGLSFGAQGLHATGPSPTYGITSATPNGGTASFFDFVNMGFATETIGSAPYPTKWKLRSQRIGVKIEVGGPTSGDGSTINAVLELYGSKVIIGSSGNTKINSRGWNINENGDAIFGENGIGGAIGVKWDPYGNFNSETINIGSANNWDDTTTYTGFYNDGNSGVDSGNGYSQMGDMGGQGSGTVFSVVDAGNYSYTDPETGDSTNYTVGTGNFIFMGRAGAAAEAGPTIIGATISVPNGTFSFNCGKIKSLDDGSIQLDNGAIFTDGTGGINIPIASIGSADGSGIASGFSNLGSLTQIGDWNGEGHTNTFDVDDSTQRYNFNGSFGVKAFVGATLGNLSFDNGLIHSDGSGHFYAVSVTPSDKRLKDNIQIIESPLDKLSKINGYSFVWKKDGKSDVGVIAQEIESVLPEAVIDGTDGFKAVEYSKITPLLIQCIKEQQNEIEDNKYQISRLQEELDEIKNLLYRNQIV